MQAWFCHDPTGVDALQWQEVPTPQPQAGQVLVEVHAASLNFPDLLIVQNKYQFKPPLPFVPGSEFAGLVQAVGDGVQRFKPGDRVLAMGGTGGFGSHAVVAQDKLQALPEGMSFEQGAAFVLTYGTTIHALLDRGQLKAGETVLVLGAAGGVGTAAVQIAKAAGARVIAAASTDEKCAMVKQMGADETINYSTANLRDALKAATGGKGPDLVYDPVGGDLAEPVFRSIAWRGRYLVVGFAGGGIPALPWNLALLKGASVVGVFWGDFVRREPEAFANDMAQLSAWFSEGKVRPLVQQTLKLSELHQAYALMANRKVIGKMVLVPD